MRAVAEKGRCQCASGEHLDPSSSGGSSSNSSSSWEHRLWVRVVEHLGASIVWDAEPGPGTRAVSHGLWSQLALPCGCSRSLPSVYVCGYVCVRVLAPLSASFFFRSDRKEPKKNISLCAQADSEHKSTRTTSWTVHRSSCFVVRGNCCCCWCTSCQLVFFPQSAVNFHNEDLPTPRFQVSSRTVPAIYIRTWVRRHGEGLVAPLFLHVCVCVFCQFAFAWRCHECRCHSRQNGTESMRRWFHADERFFSLMEEGPGASQRDHGDQAARRNTALFDRFSLATHRKRPTRVATPHNVRSFTCTTHQVKSTLGAHLPAGGKRETRDARNGLTNPSRQFVFFFSRHFFFRFSLWEHEKKSVKATSEAEEDNLFCVSPISLVFCWLHLRGGQRSRRNVLDRGRIAFRFSAASFWLRFFPSPSFYERNTETKEKRTAVPLLHHLPPPSLLPKFEKKCWAALVTSHSGKNPTPQGSRLSKMNIYTSSPGHPLLPPPLSCR